jgi:UPF0716 family protein affecting phage T7 exclusion
MIPRRLGVLATLAVLVALVTAGGLLTASELREALLKGHARGMSPRVS